MISALLLSSVIGLLVATESIGEIFTVDQTRQIASSSEVALAFLPPLFDGADSGPDRTLGLFNGDASTSVELSFLNKTTASSSQVSGFNLAPNSGAIAVRGVASLSTTVSNPGFSTSRSGGFAVSLFDWIFSINSPTQYSLNATLTSELLGYSLYGAGSITETAPLASQYRLSDYASGSILHDDFVVDPFVDGLPVTHITNHEGTLEPGTYRLIALSSTEVYAFEDASTAGGTTFQVDLTLTTVFEPGNTLTDFNEAGGYAAYLAEPTNADLLQTGVCDEDAAFADWRDFGLGEGRLFAQGQLRTDNPNGSPDSDYAIDSGFAWEYPQANTVVFITADAPKPNGWAGRALLLERCQTFNIGAHYNAQTYRSINTDVANAIDQGLVPSFQSVTDHYVKYGFKEGRLTSANWTEAQVNAWNDPGYLLANPDVANYFQGAANSGWSLFGKYGFAHWINFGQYEGRGDGQ